MIPTPLPERPWQKVATDLFYHNGKTYIIVVDYYLRFFEIAPLKSTTTENVINHLKSFFCRHGIPEIVVSDNGLHFQNSPKNGASQTSHVAPTTRRVTVKWKELSRPPKTWSSSQILTYRSTPLENGYTPAELLMSPEKLIPKLSNFEQLRRTERAYKQREAENYNKRHRASVLPDLNPVDKVWIPGKSSPASGDSEISSAQVICRQNRAIPST